MGRPIQERVSIGLLILIGAGLLLRFLLYYVSLHWVGSSGDLYAYAGWVLTLVDVGPHDFYQSIKSDYPPGYLYILWMLGKIDQVVASLTHADPLVVVINSIKIPPILLDAGVGLMIYRIVRRWSADSIDSEKTALLATAIYTFNPVICYSSAIWGQTDSVGIFAMLVTLLSLMRGPPEIAAAVAVLAGLLKPQFGFVAIPLVGIVLSKRYLSAAARAQWRTENGPIRLLSSAAVGIVVLYAAVAPFNLTARSFIARMAETAGQYPFLSVNAFNPWALTSSNETPALIVGSLGGWSRDDIPLLGPISGLSIGTTLLAIGFLIGALRLLWRSDTRSIVLVGAYLCICFFILPTRVHERYGIAAFAFLSLLTAIDRRWLWATLAWAIGSLINLHAVLSDNRVLAVPAPEYSKRTGAPLPLGDFCESPIGIAISIALQTAVFAFTLWSLRPASAESRTRLFTGGTSSASLRC